MTRPNRTLRGRRKPDSPRFGASRVLRDAASLGTSSIVNAAFGLATWAITAHLIAPAQLGVMTAVLAAITAPALAVATTIGGTYTSLLPAVGSARPAIFRRGQRLFLVSSVIGGVIAGLATIAWIDGVHGSLPVFALVVVGTVLLGTLLLQGTILPAIGRASWVITMMFTMNVLKICMLITFATTFFWHSFELATVVSAGLVAVTLVPFINRIIRTSNSLPSTSSLTQHEAIKEFDRFVIRLFFIVLFSYATFAFTPFLVTAFGGPRAGALFALALSVAQTLDLLSSAMGTSLAVHASAEPETATAMARTVLVRSLAVTAAGAVAITLSISTILRFLNPEYLSMGAVGVTAVLCLGPVVRTFFVTWWGLERARRRLRPTLIVSLLGAVVCLTTVPVLSSRYGALGGAAGITLAYCALSLGAMVHTLIVRRARERNRAAV